MAARYPELRWAGTDGPKDALWLAREAGAPALGCVAMRVHAPDLVEVKHLYVTGAARRRGVASALMDALEAEAARRGARIVLETGFAQPEAIAFYQARGYRRRGRYRGADPEDACSVYLELSAVRGIS
jgi:putative acetyltransferase